MNEYLITYDLRGEDRDYSEIEEAIEELFPNPWHELGSVWVVRTKLDAKAIMKRLKEHLVKGDGVFVVQIDKDYRGRGYTNKFEDWRKGSRKK